MNSADFLNADRNSGKVKVTLIFIGWVGMVKNEYGVLVHEALISAVSQE